MCTDIPPFRPTLTCLQQFVFTPTCAKSGCHLSPAQQNQDLSAGMAYSNIVGVRSMEVPALFRVEPGDPNHSYIVMKVQGSSGIVGVQMPADGPPYLSQAEMDVLRRWILDGALDN